jgi:hypothetical protein
MHHKQLLAILTLLLASALRAQDAGWTRLVPQVSASGGETFAVDEQAVVQVSGPRPEASTYELNIALALEGGTTALRLEAFAHESLPMKGPGRADNGHAVLTEFEAFFAPGTSKKFSPIAFRGVDSDEARWRGSQPDGHVRVIDGIKGTKTGWVIDGAGAHRDRHLFLVPAQPIGAKGQGALRVRMHFDSGWAGHELGRFRLSATNATDPAKLLPKPPTVGAAKVELAIDKGVDWLLRHQGIDGSWLGPDSDTYRAGMTGLAVYTLLKCGLPADHPALLSAMAWLGKERPTRTYDVGCTLMALAEFGSPESKPLIASLTASLVRSMGGGPNFAPGEWGYPGTHGNPAAIHADLSNSQYALLGLRAAAKAGEKIPASVWTTVIEWLSDRQESYGGFGYTKGARATASMTAAGSGCLLIAAHELERVTKAEDPGVVRARAAAKRGAGWIKDHWSVQQNVEGAFVPGKTYDRWLYYWLYGLERVGSLSGERLIGDHDWYQEGAAEIVRHQNGDGHWNIGGYSDHDSDTCFALLFLRRGSGTTQPAPRAGAHAGAADAIQISASSEWPPAMWVRAVGPAVEERVAAGAKVLGVRWFVNDEDVAFVKASVDDVRADPFSTRWETQRNGSFKVKAMLEFEPLEGKDDPVSSAELPLRVDGAPLKRHGEARRDARTNLLRGQQVTIAASSEHDGHPATKALDGRQTTCWLAMESDTQPTVTLRLARPAQSSVLKLGVPRSYEGDRHAFARPRSVQLKINNEAPLVVELSDDVERKHAINFPKTLVRTLKLTILSTYAGSGRQTGWQELELFPAPHADDASAVRQEVIAVQVPAGRDSPKVLWRWTTSDPGGGWEAPTFKDFTWKEGMTPFGDLPAGRVPGRTPWATREIWLRKSFALGQMEPGRWRLEVFVDDSAFVFVNGVSVGEVPFSGGQYVSVALSDEVAATLKPGQNLIALHAINTGGPGALDVALRYVPTAGK